LLRLMAGRVWRDRSCKKLLQLLHVGEREDKFVVCIYQRGRKISDGAKKVFVKKNIQIYPNPFYQSKALFHMHCVRVF